MIYSTPFFFPSTIWSIQSHTETTTGTSPSHITSIFSISRGFIYPLYFFLQAIPTQTLLPSSGSFLYFCTQMWSWHEVICLIIEDISTSIQVNIQNYRNGTHTQLFLLGNLKPFPTSLARSIICLNHVNSTIWSGIFLHWKKSTIAISRSV